ncbi:MAG: caspase family protein [Bernardetiaceae bacterium]|nr:caspase family protein [Bernardetiaceae bacterium]
MRYIFRFLFLHLLTCWIYLPAQAQDLQWEKQIVFDKPTEAISTIMLADNSYLLLGNKQIEGSLTKKLVIVKISPAQEIVWQKEIKGNGSYEAKKILLVGDDSYIIIANIKPENNTSYQGMIAKLNAEGDIIWEKVLSNGDLSLLEDALAHNDKIIAIGRTRTDRVSKAWFVSIDKEGSILQNKAIESEGTGYAKKIEVTDNNTLLIAGDAYISEKNTEDIWVLEVNRSNVTVISEYYVGGNKRDNIATIIPIKKGKNWIWAQSESFTTSKQPVLLQTDKKGKIRKQINIEIVGSMAQYGVKDDDNNTLLVTNNNEDCYVFKYDKNGKQLWQTKLSKRNAQQISYKSSGEVMIVGKSYENPNSTAMWIASLGEHQEGFQDKQKPSIKVDIPEVVLDANFILEGKVFDNKGVLEVRVNDKPIPFIPTTGDFNTNITLEEGDNNIKITVTDAANNIAEQVYKVSYKRRSEDVEKRIAFIVGNSVYESLNSLESPKKDATDIAEALQQADFETIVLKDLSKTVMDSLFEKFLHKVKTENYQTALFYYSGHGMEADGKPYALPTDVEGRTLTRREADALCFNIEDANAKLKDITSVSIIVLDACRERLTRGGKIEQNWKSDYSSPKGTFIAYATTSGMFAEDGLGTGNSAYTSVLLRHILVPNLTINQIFKRVREDVIKQYGEEHRPWDSDSMVGTDFYFIKK